MLRVKENITLSRETILSNLLLLPSEKRSTLNEVCSPCKV